MATKLALGNRSTSYVVVTPVRDEEAHVERTIEAMATQTVVPLAWVVVNDGSSDRTGDILDRWASKCPWMRVLHRANRGRRANGSGVMEAFYDGFALVADLPWEFIVKLDGDLSFEPDYFQQCFVVFAEHSGLGIGGGTICDDRNGVLEVESKNDPPFHVRGATKIYRRECWDAIFPLMRAPGWDTIDEIKANMLGWDTRSFAHLSVLQLKATGSADGTWRNAFKNGRANYVTGYDPIFMAAKCLKRALARPRLVAGLAMACGFGSAYAARVPQVPDNGIIAYLRRQQRRRLLLRPSIYG